MEEAECENCGDETVCVMVGGVLLCRKCAAVEDGTDPDEVENE